MKWWNEQNKHRRGFTLLEVVAVVAMLGVLASMLLPSVETYVSRSRDMKLTADLSVVDSAIVLYRLDEGALPASLVVTNAGADMFMGSLQDGAAALGLPKFTAVDNDRYPMVWTSARDVLARHLAAKP